jgi:hypothetical protein
MLEERAAMKQKEVDALMREKKCKKCVICVDQDLKEKLGG